MQGDELSNFGKAEAQQIQICGWRQGSVFRPPAEFLMPVHFDYENEFLVVCTQSCSVVSDDQGKNPHIEFIVANPAGCYKSNAPEATGKILRCFHLPISGIPDIDALDLPPFSARLIIQL